MPGALDQWLKVKPTAQPILGPKIQRKHMMKKLWERINQKGLKDPKDGRIIHVERDPELRRIFGSKPLHMTKLMKPLNEHVE